VALLLTQFAIILVRSRAVWVAGILSAASVALIVFLIIRNRPVQALFSGYGKSLVVVIVALLVAVVVSAMLFGHYNPAFSPWARMASIFDLESGSISQRLLLWRKSVEMIKDNLMLGVGLGHWRIMLPSYGTAGMWSEGGIVHWQRPHNDFIWVLAETGLPGLIAYLSLFVIIMAYSVRIIARSEDAREKIFTALMLFGLIGYIVIASFSFPKERPMHSILLVLLMAGIVSIYHRTFPLPKWATDKPVLPLAIPVFILLISAVVAERRQIDSEVHTKRALEARENGQWSRVIDEINRAETGLSVMDPMATPLTWYRGVARFTLDDIDNAQADFEKAYRVHPYHIHVLNNLATCYELRGQHQLAIGYYLQALAVSPANEEVLINLGAAYYNSGRYRDAYATLLKCDTTTADARLLLYLEAIRNKLER
ncbi:MAG: O-antigen ligase family protein, partial [Candidatus Marinimicrobia bacterium]|nr:O-antigen ligase family protein [Candidatus Neomarinimicrobiota bacterium]